MPKTGAANLPLHSGRAPRWLFDTFGDSACAGSPSFAVLKDAEQSEVQRQH